MPDQYVVLIVENLSYKIPYAVFIEMARQTAIALANTELTHVVWDFNEKPLRLRAPLDSASHFDFGNAELVTDGSMVIPKRDD